MFPIQNYAIEIFVFLVLTLLAIIDIKKKEFPAVLTSGLLFVVAIVKFSNIEFGIMAFILAWFLMEADFFGGVGDLKIITILGFFVNELGMFLVLAIMVVIFGTVYKILMIKVMKKDMKDDIAFIPVLLAVYVALIIITRFIL